MKKLTLILIGLFTLGACSTDFDQINEDLHYLNDKIDSQYEEITSRISSAEHNLDTAVTNLEGLETSLKAYVDGLILELSHDIEEADSNQDLEIQNIQGEISILEGLVNDVEAFNVALSQSAADIDSLYQDLSQSTDGNRDHVLAEINRIETSVEDRVGVLSDNIRTTLGSLPAYAEAQIAETLTALNLEGSIIEVILEQFTLEVTELTSECDSIIDSLTDAQTLEYNELRQKVTPEGLQASVFTDVDGNDYSSPKDLDCDGDITLYDHILLYIVGLSSF